MAKSYRPVLRDQPFLLPPHVRDWLPADHAVWFLLETMEALDTSAFHGRRRLGGVGAAGYDPDMLLALLIYAYCQGVRSSRQIETRCTTDVAFRVLCAQDTPGHATIARFRVEHEGTLAALFTQVLLIAAHAGLARLGTVAIDGTKIPANASIDANRGKEWLDDQVRLLITEAQQLDAAEEAASTAAVAAPMLADHGVGGDIQRGEQAGGAVAHVVVGGAPGCCRHHRQHRRGAVPGLHLRLLIDRENHRRLRRTEVEPDNVLRGWAATDTAGEYEEHYQSAVVPALRQVPGFRGARLLRRVDGVEIELVSVTFFDDLDAIRAFAEADHATAVVAGEARRVLTRFEERVSHYEVAVEA